MSQSSLNEFFTPSLKFKQSLPAPISFCTITDFLLLCLYSTGFSSVNIFLFWFSFISFIKAFNVVVLPEFVLPVTNISPCGWYVILLTISGTPKSSYLGSSFFISLIVNIGISFAKDIFTLKRISSNSKEVSSFFVSLKTRSLSTFPLTK